MFAITVRQPYAWAIIEAGKDIENRDWPTNIRGPVAIHAAKGMTATEYDSEGNFIAGIIFSKLSTIDRIPKSDDLVKGAIIGVVDIVDCLPDSASPWFVGNYGFVLKNPRKLEVPIPCNGKLSFWTVPQEIEQALIDQLDSGDDITTVTQP